MTTRPAPPARPKVARPPLRPERAPLRATGLLQAPRRPRVGPPWRQKMRRPTGGARARRGRPWGVIPGTARMACWTACRTSLATVRCTLCQQFPSSLLQPPFLCYGATRCAEERYRCKPDVLHFKPGVLLSVAHFVLAENKYRKASKAALKGKEQACRKTAATRLQQGNWGAERAKARMRWAAASALGQATTTKAG